MKRIILLLGFLPFAALAQQAKSLKECIAYGLQNHLSKGIYANDILNAKSQSKEALSAYLPSVNGTVALDDNLMVQQQIIPAGVFGPTDTKVAFTKQYSSNGFVQLDQTIFDQSLLVGLKANKFNNKVADLSSLQNDEKIVYNITTAYYQIFVYREQLNLLKANLASYAEQERISQLQVEKGTLSEVDLNKVQVNYNNTNSQILVTENNIELSENQLKNAMGFPLAEQIVINSISKIDIAAIANNADSFTVENRLDFQLSTLNISLLDIDKRRIKAGALPKLTAYGKYGAVGFGDKFGQTFSSLSDYSTIGLKLAVPIFDGFKRKAQYDQAKFKQMNAEVQQKLDKQAYQLEYKNAQSKMTKAQKSLVNDQRNITLAQSVFKSTDLQYQKGVTDLTVWLNAQYALKEAQSNYLNSLYNYYLSVIDTEKSNGTLIKFYNTL